MKSIQFNTIKILEIITEDMTEIIEDSEIFEIEVFKKPKNNYQIQDFTQSQAHGLFWDNEIRQKVFCLPPCKNDTTKYDICCSDNKFNCQENISIKTSSNNNIDCADILRFFNGDFTNKYTIILLRYNQVGVTKTIKEIIEIDYNHELKNYLFGSITEEELNNYVSAIKAIPPGRVSTSIKDSYKKIKNQLQKQHCMNINISPKVDSKNQRRVQCSIPKVEQLLNKFPQIIISRTSESILRGVNITSTINSSPRLRKSSNP